MNKLRKEDLQKIILGVFMLFGIVWGYFDLLLGPLKARQTATTKSLKALEPEIQKARTTLKRVQSVEADAPNRIAVLEQIDAMIPDGAPVAWFPVLVGDFFRKAGFDKTVTRMNTEVAEKELPGYRRVSWGVDLPRVDLHRFGAAIAEFENEEPLVEVQAMSIETMRDDPESQRVLLTLNNIVKK